MFRALICLTLFANSIFLQSQDLENRTSDKYHWYVLLDVSGSMRSDYNKNSIEVVKQLERMLSRDALFNVYLLGDEETAKKRIGSYKYKSDRNAPIPSKELNSVIDRLQNAKDYDERSYFAITDINSGLEYMVEEIFNEKLYDSKEIVNGGLIIISDGLLRPKDIPKDKEINSYTKETKELLSKLESKIPMYFIQTSNYKARDFLTVRDSLESSDIPNYIWIDNRKNLRTDSAMLTTLQELVQFMVSYNYQPIHYKPKQNQVMPFILDINRYIKHNSVALAALDKSEIKEGDIHNISPLKLIDAENELIKKIIANDKMTQVDASKNYTYINELRKKPIAELYASGFEAFPTLPDPPTTLIPDDVAIKSQGRNIQESIILGISDYLIERVESEIAFIFYQQLKDFIEDEIIIKEVLFRDTYNLFSNNSESDPPTIPLLREAFKRDLDQLPARIINVPHVADKKAIFFLEIITRLMKQVQKGEDLESVIAKLAPNTVDPSLGTTADYQRGIYFICRYYQFLSENDFVREIENASHEERQRIILMSVAWFVNEHPEIKEVTNVNKLVTSILEINESVLILKNSLEILKKQLAYTPQSDFDGYRKYINNIATTYLKEVLSVIHDGILLNSHFSELESNKVQEYQQIAMGLIDGYFLLQEKEYVQASLTLLPLIAEISVAKNENRDKLMKLLQISSQIAVEPSADKVKNLISTYALPTASYRLKRENQFELNLNAFVGMGVGYFNSKPELITPVLSAPIGIDISFNPYQIRKKNHGDSYSRNMSFFISVLDVGNIINYRINKADSALNEDVKFEQIFSPGFFLTWSPFRKLPLSFAIGYQTRPDRFASFLAFDLPIIRLRKTKMF